MLKELFHKISVKIGFTENELKVLFFVVIVFCVGLFGKYLFVNFPGESAHRAQNGSTLPQGMKNKQIGSSFGINEEKKVESERKVSDFSTNDKNANYKKSLPALKNKVNLNSAGIDELVLLPGIGKKTAMKIIDYRNKHGKFNDLSELKNVKGIGKNKFEKIKKLIRL